MTMTPAAGAQLLSDVSTPERAGERPAARLAEVRDLLGDDLAFVAAEVERSAAVGPSPGADAAGHLAKAGGKRVRPMLVLLGAAAFRPATPAARDLAVVAELVHLATLLHDDVIDDGDERRGQPTARRVFGNAVSVLAGDLLLTHALERTARAAPAALPSLVATLRRLVDGEIVQLRGRMRLDVDRATYERVVRDKTASLFGWAARAGAAAAGAGEGAQAALERYGEELGVAFQIVDDVLDFEGDPRATGKSLLADAREGKLTLPLLLAVELRPELEAELARARAGDEAAALRLGEAVRGSTACATARARAVDHTTQAIGALAALPASPVRELLAAVGQDLARRAS